jgi:hypothetical protein
MATCHLRLFPEAAEDTAITTEGEATVPIRLGELIPVLRQALRSNYVWLRDFQDDEVRVTQDFYDVIRAFQNLRPSA